MPDTSIPKAVKVEGRNCFGIAYFTSEADAQEYADEVRRQGLTYNGGFFHGKPCGRDETWDHVDAEHGQLYAVTD